MSAVGSILTNTGALDALQGISASTATNSTLEGELSSGLAINSPADNPAGYITAQGFTSQLNGITQAISNANEGVSLLQTAQGALSQQIGVVQSLNSIAVQAANGTQTPEESQSLQSVASQLVAQVNTIANTTQFNNINLLNGTFSGVQIQDGANEGQNLSLTIGNTQGNAIGLNASTVNYTATPWAAGNPYTSKVNSGSASGGFTGAAAGTAFTAANVTWTGANGQTGTAAVTTGESAANIAAAVNATTGNTGVSAQANTTYTFAANDGALGAGFAFKLQGSGSSKVTINAQNIQQLAQQINGNTGTTGITASLNSANTQITLTQANGQNISITGWTPASGSLKTLGVGSAKTIKAGSASATIQGQVQLQSSAAFNLTNGGDIGLKANSNLTSLDQINVTTTAGANTAINVVKFALDSLNKQGGQLGATQQALTANINNLNTTAQNVTTALGSVQDANIPQVSQQLTQAQIRAQSGVAALKDSSQLQQSYLSLLG